jgi:hypothetical protein
VDLVPHAATAKISTASTTARHKMDRDDLLMATL